MLVRIPLVLVIVALTAVLASAQISVLDPNDPFANYQGGNRGGLGGGNFLFGGAGAGAVGGAIGGAPLGGITIKFPEAVSVSRPLKLRPPKPVMVLEGETATDARVKALDADLRTAARRLMTARKARDYTATRKLLREMESIRQRRLSHIRKVAKLVVPDPPAGSDPTSPALDSSAPPLLPLPTAPKSLGN